MSTKAELFPGLPRDPNRAAAHILTEKEQQFVKLCAKGVTPAKAAVQVFGPAKSNLGRELLRRPAVKHALMKAYRQLEQTHHMSRSKVMEGFKRAADMAEQLADPMAMISAYREMGKMCGYYAVETKKVEVSVSGQIGIKKLNALSDEELMKLAKGEVLEGEFAQVVGEEAGDESPGALSDFDQDVIDAINAGDND